MRQAKVENIKFQSPGGSRRERHTKYYKTQKTFSDKSSQQRVLQELKKSLRFWKLTLKIIQAALQIRSYYPALTLLIPTPTPAPRFCTSLAGVDKIKLISGASMEIHT
jgi:hypothetical protein